MGETSRVLIVDDHYDGATALGQLLRTAGCDVRVVQSGVEAIKAAPKFKPHLVILDISMPGMDGFETAVELKKQTWSEEAIYIAHTGLDDTDSVKRIKESGFDHYVRKPSSFAVFEGILAGIGKESPKPAR